MSSETSQLPQQPEPDCTRVSWLVNIDTRQRYPLTEAGLGVGRIEDNELCLKDDVYVSGRHAQIYFEGDVCWLKDLDSRNGTFLNNQQVSGAVTVKQGDIITFGRTKFEVS